MLDKWNIPHAGTKNKYDLIGNMFYKTDFGDAQKQNAVTIRK